MVGKIIFYEFSLRVNMFKKDRMSLVKQKLGYNHRELELEGSEESFKGGTFEKCHVTL